MRTCDLTLSRAAMVIVVGLSFVWALALAQDAPPAEPVAPLPKPPPAKAPAAPVKPAAPVVPAAPVAPAAPVKPAASVAPAVPATPAGPAAPAAPAVPATAPATAPAPVVVAKDLRTAWENFLHYILIARADLAESHGKAIVQANPDPKDLYALAMESKEAGPTLARGRSLENVAPIIDQINKLIDEGARGVRMDPAEIARWIKALGGPLMGYDQAKERLKVSGQYAVPQLIDALENPATSATVRERIINLLPALGKEAVRPLNEVLLNTKDATVREVAARTLGRIGYPHAAPYLKELAQRKDILDRTRDAALGALAECAGKAAANKPVAELYYDLATKYYRHDDSVNPDSRYDTSNVWYWQNGTGLTFKVVPRAIFNDIYAMRTAQAALAHDAAFAPAVELWLAANLRREAGLPAGAKDPTYPADRPGAKFHILAASAQFQQGVLRRGLADGDLAVIVGAIGALEKTAGTKNLVGVVADAQGGAQPLVQALTYAARVVRYMAAEALAKARPEKAFNGSHLVVPVLAEALRQTGAPIAVLADPEQEHRNKLKDLLRGAGCVAYDADALGKALEQARGAGGVDVLVLASNIANPSLAEAHQQIRSEGVLSRVPIFLAARAADMIEARQLAKNDPLLTVLPEDKQTAEGLAEAMKAAAAGGLPEDQAGEWAVRAARAIELLAMTRNGVYDLDLARGSLIATLGDKRDAVRVAAADALAQFDKPDAQRAVVELANAADAPEPVRIAAYAAASKSVRSFGNTLTEKHVQDVIGVVESSGALPLREAAAQLLGALNLPSEKIKSLVINAK